MRRREMLLSLAGGASASLLASHAQVLSAECAGRTGLGVCIYCLGIRSRAEAARGEKAGFSDPLRFLEVCGALGAGGIQAPLGAGEPSRAARLLRRAEQLEMFLEGIATLPRDESDATRFDAELRTAEQAGARVVRVVMLPGRRYERFDSAEQFRQFQDRGLKSLQLAEPIAARRRVRLALENHKGQRVPERLELLQRISSPWVGACVDTGNSFALLEDPIEVVKAYAPWAASVHLKDQAVRPYQDGFLLADAPLGEGFLDLPRMIRILREANPAIHFNLEVITRDPLKVPCLTEAYWATLNDVPGRDLARTLRIVRDNTAEKLLNVKGLSPDEQVELEDRVVRKCLAYARDRLGMLRM